MLRVLRESAGPASRRPTLAEADRLLDSARTSGATVDAEVSGGLEQIPVAVSQEGYRILQEALTNVLRHSGPVPVARPDCRRGRQLDLEVTNPADRAGDRGTTAAAGCAASASARRCSAARAQTGPRGDDWTVSAQLPLQRSKSCLRDADHRSARR